MKTGLLLLTACLAGHLAMAQPLEVEFRGTWTPEVRYVRGGQLMERQMLVSYGTALRFHMADLPSLAFGVNISYGRSQRRGTAPLTRRVAVIQVEVPVLFQIIQSKRLGIAVGTALGVARSDLYEYNPPGSFRTPWLRQSRRTSFSASLMAEAGVELCAGLGLRAGLAYQVLSLNMSSAGPIDPETEGDRGQDFVTPVVFKLSGWHPYLGLTKSFY